MNKNIYKEKSIHQLILLFGIPSTLALIIEMCTGITDTAFAGNLPLIGESALTSMALISPLLSLFTALQTLFAMSSGILVAKYFDNTQMRNNALIVGIRLSSLISIITSILCGLYLKPILQIIGAEGQTFYLATNYMQIQLFSNVISSLGYTMTCSIRAIGYPNTEMKIITFSVICNIFFNALLSFGFNLGIQGLALGTLISEIICMLISTFFLYKKKMLYFKTNLTIKQTFNLGIEMFKIGFAQTAIQMLAGCTGFFVNNRLLHISNALSIAAWNIAQRIYTFLLMPIVGLTQGIQTVIAYFYANNQSIRVKNISSLVQKYCFLYGILAVLLTNLFSEKILLLFASNLEILTLSKTILLIISSCIPLVGIFYTNMSMLQVTGKEISSVSLALTRQVFLMLPLIILLPSLFTMFNMSPIIGLFLATPVADILVVFISAIVKKRTFSQSVN